MKIIETDKAGKERIFALAYGSSGTGKTHLVGTLGALGKVLLIDIDQGGKTMQYAKDLQKYHDNITMCSFDQFKDLDQAYKLVDANDPAKWNAFFNAPKKPGMDGYVEHVTEPFDWIAWDTWSEIQWFMMQELRMKNDRMGVGIDFRKNIEIQHWGQMTDLNKLAVQALRACKVNQLFTMQETLMKDELSGQIFGGPAIHGKMVQEMPAFFDIVIHTYTDLQGRFCAATKSKGKWTAKTRLGEGAEIVNPTAKDLFTV